MGLVALTENLILLQFEFCIDYDAEEGGKVLLKRNDVESCVLLEHVSNRKADSYVKLNVKMEDYYRIKDSKGGESDEGFFGRYK